MTINWRMVDVYVYIYFTAVVIVKAVNKDDRDCWPQDAVPTPGHVIQPLQVALQDGDSSTSWRPFQDGDNFVQVTLDIVMPSDSTVAHLILSVSDLPCQGGGLIVYNQVNTITDDVSRCGRKVNFQECALLSGRGSEQECAFSCHKWCDDEYLTVLMQFQRLRWIQYDPTVSDLSVEFS